MAKYLNIFQLGADYLKGQPGVGEGQDIASDLK